MSNNNVTQQLLRLPEILRRTGVSRSTIYSLEASGRFPRRVHVSERCSAWNSVEIDAWIAERLATREVKA